jgi:hypothetical protein
MAPWLYVRLKKSHCEQVGVSPEEGIRLEDECAKAILQTEDVKEGPMAYLEHRKPYYVER